MAAAPLSTPPDVIPTPGSPGPEMPPLTPTRPAIHPGHDLPEEVPQVPDPDVGTPPPEQVPTPIGPDLVPPPAPSPGGPPVMTAAGLVLLTALAAACLAPRSAWAQAEQSPLPDTTPPEVRDGGQVGTPEGSGSTLGEELSRSEGVIKPSPEAATTDPGIVQPSPGADAGTMRVVPSPGSPGGDPNLRPK